MAAALARRANTRAASVHRRGRAGRNRRNNRREIYRSFQRGTDSRVCHHDKGTGIPMNRSCFSWANRAESLSLEGTRTGSRAPPINGEGLGELVIAISLDEVGRQRRVDFECGPNVCTVLNLGDKMKKRRRTKRMQPGGEISPSHLIWGLIGAMGWPSPLNGVVATRANFFQLLGSRAPAFEASEST